MASDLHTHTNFSDGSFSPDELVAAAKNIGLAYLAITDHDTIEGVKFLYENNLIPGKGTKIIPGIEFSVKNPEHEVHIVGYNIDIYNGVLTDMINEISDSRWARFSEIIDCLKENKYDIQFFKKQSHTFSASDPVSAYIKEGEYKEKQSGT